MMKLKIHVMIVDDHAMVRLGLSEAVSAESDMVVAAEASCGTEAVELYVKHQPDVVLMDFQMPDVNGIEATEQILESFPAARVILLSIYQGEEDIWRAKQTGVKGYLPKSATMSEVLSAIRDVYAGDLYFHPSIAAKLEKRSARADLTSREVDVLRLIVGGRSNKEMASELSISDGNVRLYVSRLLAKLGAVDRTQLAVKAIQCGLIHLEP